MSPTRKRLKNVKNRERAATALMRLGSGSFTEGSFIMKAKAYAKAAGEKWSAKAAGNLGTELCGFAADDVVHYDEAREKFKCTPETKQLFGHEPGQAEYSHKGQSQKEREERYVAHAALARDVLPEPKVGKLTKKKLLLEYAMLKGTYRRDNNILLPEDVQPRQQVEGLQQAHIPADQRRSTLPSSHTSFVATGPSTPARATPHITRTMSDPGASGSAFASPDQLLAHPFGRPPMTPVSNPRPLGRMPTIRDEPESPTPASRQLSSRMQTNEPGPAPTDAEGGGGGAADMAIAAHAHPAPLAGLPVGPYLRRGADLFVRIQDVSRLLISHLGLGGEQTSALPVPEPDGRDARIAGLEAQVADLERRLRAAEADVTSKAETIEGLRSELGERQKALEDVVSGWTALGPTMVAASRLVHGGTVGTHY